MMQGAQALPVGYRLFGVMFAPGHVRESRSRRPVGGYPFVLSPLFGGPLYLPYGRRHKAQCSSRRLHSHLMESVRLRWHVHGCGFYGVWDIRDLCDLTAIVECRTDYPTAVLKPWVIMGAVRPFGTVASARYGFRASHIQLEWFFKMPVAGDDVGAVALAELFVSERSERERIINNEGLLVNIATMLARSKDELVSIRNAEELLRQEGIRTAGLKWHAYYEDAYVSRSYITFPAIYTAIVDNGIWVEVVPRPDRGSILVVMLITYDKLLRILSYNYDTPILPKPETWG